MYTGKWAARLCRDPSKVEAWLRCKSPLPHAFLVLICLPLKQACEQLNSLACISLQEKTQICSATDRFRWLEICCNSCSRQCDSGDLILTGWWGPRSFRQVLDDRGQLRSTLSTAAHGLLYFAGGLGSAAVLSMACEVALRGLQEQGTYPLCPATSPPAYGLTVNVPTEDCYDVGRDSTSSILSPGFQPDNRYGSLLWPESPTAIFQLMHKQYDFPLKSERYSAWS